MKITTYHCPSCGSSSIVREAWAAWNEEEWFVAEFCDHSPGADAMCYECGDVFGADEIVEKQKEKTE